VLPSAAAGERGGEGHRQVATADHMLNRWIERNLLDVLGQEGVACIVFSRLALGLLTDRHLEGTPADSRVATGGAMSRDMLTEENLARVRALNEIAGRRGADPGPDGPRLDAPRPEGHLHPERSEQRGQLEEASSSA